MSLEDFGWHPFFQAHFHEHSGPGREPGRVVTDFGDVARVHTEHGEVEAITSGRLKSEARSREDLPAVGDWVVVERSGDRAVVEAVLPRRTRLVRKAAGRRIEEQVVAANVDAVLLVMSLNNDLNPRRVERYLTAIWDSGASPVVLLSKADLCDDVPAAVAAVEAVALGAPVHALSARDGIGLEALAGYAGPGRTVALVGSSGAGKSTLANWLLGADVQATRGVRRRDDRGVHTTTRRDLLRIPGGGLVLDTPGMRTLLLWAVGGGLGETFGDVEGLAAGCRFRDCAHGAEPGCAVRAALGRGELDAGRLASYLKLRREGERAAIQADAVARRAQLETWKRMTREGRARARAKRS